MLEQKSAAQEAQSPVRSKLEESELYDIKSNIRSIFHKNNLSIRQARSILATVSEELEDCRPWRKASGVSQ